MRKITCASSLISFIFTSIFFITFSFAAINVVPMKNTPYPDNAKIEIVYPENMEMKNSLPIRMVVRVSNYSLGNDSEFERKEEIKNWDIGQCIRVIIDNNPFFAKITDQIDPFDDEAIYFESSYEFNLPEPISEGAHTIRAYLVRSYGESLKAEKAFQASTFYYKNINPLKGVDLKKPYLTCNEPAPNQTYNDNNPLLLDFYIKNCELSRDGYKVKLTIDNETIKYLDKWVPYYIYGLRKGTHKIDLQLVDSKNNIVPGLFNNNSTQVEVD